jgi:DNA-binding MarR family transcriptional regulator
MYPLDQDPADVTPEEIQLESMELPNKEAKGGNQRRFAIYQALEEHGELTFNELAEEVTDKMARNTVQKRVDEMKKDGIIDQTPSNNEWRQGQCKKFSLTTTANSALRRAIEDLKIAKLDYLYGYEYDEDTEEVSVREDAPGIVWITTLETYHNDSNVDHIELCREKAEKMLGDTMHQFSNSDTVTDAFEKLHEQAVQIAAGKVLSEVFTSILHLNHDMKQDVMMVACAEVAEFGDFWDDVWKEDWDVPHPDMDK